VLLALFAESLNGELTDETEMSVDLFPAGSYDIQILANSTTVEVIENTSAQFTLTVTSTSNNPTGIVFNVTSAMGWVVEVNPSAGSIDPDGWMESVLSVYVPHNTLPGTHDSLGVRAISLRNGTAFGSISLTVKVELLVAKLTLDLTSPTVFVASGETTSTLGFVRNRGNNHDNITLRAGVPDSWVASFVPQGLDLDRGELGGFELLISAPSDLSGTGTLDVNVSAMSEGLVFEEIKVLRIVYNTAELLVDAGNVTINPTAPKAGESVTVQAIVINAGAVVATDIVVALISDGVEVDRTIVNTIPVSGVGIATLTFTPNPGDHLMRVIVDPDGEVDEIDEENNIVDISLDVASPDLRVAPEDITIDPSYPREGSEATITIVVWNGRSLASGPFQVSLSVDDVLAQSFSIDAGLLGYSNASLEYTWTALEGRHTFKVEMDLEGAVEEEDLSNNEASRAFSVNTMPIAKLSVSKEVVLLGEDVTLDGSESDDPDGRVRQWFFDYGDGTDSGWTFTATVNHTYNSPGEYEIRLYVKDEAGAQNDEPIVFNVTVKRKGSQDDPSPLPWGMFALVAFGVMATLMVASRRHQRT
jgi:hypothetical protein